MRFTRDPAKNAANVGRHGIAFQNAARIFDGPTVDQIDDRFDYGEEHTFAIGLVNVSDDPDAQPTDEAFWREARVVIPRRKETVTKPKTDWRRLRSMTDDEIRAAIDAGWTPTCSIGSVANAAIKRG